MSKEHIVHQKLLDAKKTVAFAESCTGGSLAGRLTANSGASDIFLGGIVSYTNEVKHKVLGVSKETLRVSGAVSRETVDEMLIGLMKRIPADFGVAISGIAGPTGGTSEKPVGTVYIGVASRGKKPHIIHCQFEGDRSEIIEASCEKALEELSYIIE